MCPYYCHLFYTIPLRHFTVVSGLLQPARTWSLSEFGAQHFEICGVALRYSVRIASTTGFCLVDSVFRLLATYCRRRPSHPCCLCTLAYHYTHHSCAPTVLALYISLGKICPVFAVIFLEQHLRFARSTPMHQLLQRSTSQPA